MPSPSCQGSWSGLPNRAGVGLKAEHFDEILDREPDIGFFEVHAENYMGAGGAPHAALREIRDRYPLSLHGVGLSIGGPGRLDEDHLARLARLVDLYQPEMFSEHLAWSSHGDAYLNDLLPLPYTKATLARVIDHVDQVQERLGRRMLLENPATVIVFPESLIPETEFLGEVARATGCGLLLDVNNVVVSATNHGFRPESYLARLPVAHVAEIHLAGHATETLPTGARLAIDTHDRPVGDGVWALYFDTIRRIGPCPTLIEWDNDVPPWRVLAAEAALAEAVMARASVGLAA
ncbi:MNIO family bufferin maturase [Prosthecomicrobium sp. N25]|uniref:MNIO family bufferin maturase n=1 Tax=Prosthecomicrobium sp. N25 TaxID=3129254 RepID=UPI0030788B00